MDAGIPEVNQLYKHPDEANQNQSQADHGSPAAIVQKLQHGCAIVCQPVMCISGNFQKVRCTKERGMRCDFTDRYFQCLPVTGEHTDGITLHRKLQLQGQA